MEKAEICIYTEALTQRIFQRLYHGLSFSPRKKARTVARSRKIYYRLETDSSEEEKSFQKTSSVQIQTEGYIHLQEEIIKKEKEIRELKQVLLETQKKLKRQSKEVRKAPRLIDSGVQAEEICLTKNEAQEKEEEIKKTPQFAKLEEMVFVSKKNKLVFENAFKEIGIKTKEEQNAEERLKAIEETSVNSSKVLKIQDSSQKKIAKINLESELFSNKDEEEKLIMENIEKIGVKDSQEAGFEEDKLADPLEDKQSKIQYKKEHSDLKISREDKAIEKREIGVSTEDDKMQWMEEKFHKKEETILQEDKRTSEVSEVKQNKYSNPDLSNPDLKAIIVQDSNNTEVVKSSLTNIKTDVQASKGSSFKPNDLYKSLELSSGVSLHHGDLPEISRQLENVFSFDKFDHISNPESSKSLAMTPSLKKVISGSKELNSGISSLKSVRDLEEMLEGKETDLKSSDSQDRLARLFQETQKPQAMASKIFTKKFNDANLSIDSRVKSPQFEMLPPNTRESFTFEPIFPMIELSLRSSGLNQERRASEENSKQEHRKSRNSSLPWIEDSEISVQKNIDLKAKHQEGSKSRPKTQEKAVMRTKPESKKSSSMNKKLPILPVKSSPVRKQRANYHSKVKAQKPERKTNRNTIRLKEDILDEIIFDEEQDSETWNKIMVKFRQNPIIISRLLKSRNRPFTQETTLRPSHVKKFSKVDEVVFSHNNPSRTAHLDSNCISNASETRPISAPEFITRPYMNRRVKDPDWSESILDNYVAQNKKKFNVFGEPTLLNSAEIEETLKTLSSNSVSLEEQKKIFSKATHTLRTLKKELMLPEFWITIPAFSNESLVSGLHKCSKLLKSRALTIKAIELIHNRENVLLDIMSNIKQELSKFKVLEKINKELIQVLVFWKYMELPFSNFVYLGQDYYSKIYEDNNNLMTLFPDFQAENIFKSEKSQDSFNFEV